MIGLMPVLLIVIIVAVVGAATHHAKPTARPASTGAFGRVAAAPHGSPPVARSGAGGRVGTRGGSSAPPLPRRADQALQAALQRWLAAGLITGEQATSIERHEMEAALAVQPEPAVERRRRIPVVAEALGYLGGILGIVGLTLLIARYWPDMGTAGRLGLSGGAAVLLAGAGYLVHEDADPALSRLRWFLWLISSAAGALFAGVLAAQGLGADAPTTIVLTVAAMVAVQNSVFWAGEHRPAQQALAMAASVVTVGALVDQFAGSVAIGMAVWVAGVLLLTFGLLHRTTFPPLTTGIGAMSVIVGTAMAAEALGGGGYLMMVLTALGLLTLATVPLDIGGPADRVVLTVIGTFGALQSLPVTIGHFAQQAGVVTGLVVWAVGGALVFAASRRVVRSPITIEVVGGIALVGGAAITGVQSPAFATLFGFATAVGLIVLGTMPGRVLLSLFGSVGLLVNVPWAILYYFPGEGRVPLLILVSGAVIVLVAVWLARLGGRFRRELHG